jgi:hypothetical protein
VESPVEHGVIPQIAQSDTVDSPTLPRLHEIHIIRIVGNTINQQLAILVGIFNIHCCFAAPYYLLYYTVKTVISMSIA